jgi:hypothetical protein
MVPLRGLRDLGPSLAAPSEFNLVVSRQALECILGDEELAIIGTLADCKKEEATLHFLFLSYPLPTSRSEK